MMHRNNRKRQACLRIIIRLTLRGQRVLGFQNRLNPALPACKNMGTAEQADGDRSC